MVTQNLIVSEQIRSDLKTLAQKVVDQQYQQNPELRERYGDTGYNKCIQDTQAHLAYLAEAIAASSTALFTNYVRWAGVLLEAFKVRKEDFSANLAATRVVLQEQLSADTVPLVNTYLEAGLHELSAAPIVLESYLTDNAPLSPLANRYLETLLKGERYTAMRLVLDAVQAGTDIKDIYLHVFQPTLYEVGRLWQSNEISIAHEHYFTAATQIIMSQLYPYTFGPRIGRSLIAACVGDELHEIGMRMVADFFEMEGWDTFFVGANTPTRSLLGIISQRKPDLLALSTTMTYHLPKVREIIDSVRARNELARIKIMVGGYPFNVSPRLWRDVGADGYAQDSDQAIQVAQELVQK